MRLLAVPVLAFGLLIGSFTDEPAEADMRAAFQATLSADVQSALDYIAEVGGAEALQRVRDAGTDRFAIRTFRKHDCARTPDRLCLRLRSRYRCRQRRAVAHRERQFPDWPARSGVSPRGVSFLIQLSASAHFISAPPRRSAPTCRHDARLRGSRCRALRRRAMTCRRSAARSMRASSGGPGWPARRCRI